MTFVLKQAREKKGFTQEYVADILDISRQTYSKIEKGETEPSLGSAVKLMELLEVSLDDFKYHEVDNQTSISFSREKYHQIIKNCIKYGASNDGMITKTKLAKLCYLADFARYYNHLEPLTNLKYLKMDQ
ncbi:MAG: helix-turn-helix transcriptional regulator [Candidatus Peribacteria bacterium]|jgi:putative transcriptional regulator|nr:helix-turn-helix transcriptional regulator [Candidatus Peribacteria bacterium]